MISRVQHGWTTPENSDACEQVLKSEIFVNACQRRIPNCIRIDLPRKNLGNEVESVRIMWFNDLHAVKAFAGEDYELVMGPLRASAPLSKFDPRSQHHEGVRREGWE